MDISNVEALQGYAFVSLPQGELFYSDGQSIYTLDGLNEIWQEIDYKTQIIEDWALIPEYPVLKN